MNELALFAGAGGGVLAGKLLGWRTICAVERDAYAAQVLAQRQNDGMLEPFPIWSDVCSFDGTRWRGIVDVVSGGFPCQDISLAGTGEGLNGKRSGLWKQMVRIICEVRPRFALVENSPALTSRGLGVVLGDLAEIGFDAKWGVLGADDVGANHRRKRIWILAHTNRLSVREQQKQFCRCETETRSDSNGKEKLVAYSNCERKSQSQGFNKNKREWSCSCSESLANTDLLHVQRCLRKHEDAEERKTQEKRPAGLRSLRRNTNWSVEPDVGRVVNGLAFRMDRLKALGNGQVPEVARIAWGQLKRFANE